MKPVYSIYILTVIFLFMTITETEANMKTSWESMIIHGPDIIPDPRQTLLKSLLEETKSIVRVVAGYSGDTLSYDPFVLYYDAKATYNFDGQLDALKLFNTDRSVTNFYVFGNDSSKLSINALPWPADTFCALRLGLKTEKDSDIIIKIKDITGIFLERSISIYDSSTGTMMVLRPESHYKVYLEAGDYQNRFFFNISTSVTTGMSDQSFNRDVLKAYFVHGILNTEIKIPEGDDGLLILTNLSGQVIFEEHIYKPGHYEFLPIIKDGIYVISLICKNKHLSKTLYACDF